MRCLIPSIIASLSTMHLKVFLSNSKVSEEMSQIAFLTSTSSLKPAYIGSKELENSQNPSLPSLSASYLSIINLASAISATIPIYSRPNSKSLELILPWVLSLNRLKAPARVKSCLTTSYFLIFSRFPSIAKISLKASLVKKIKEASPSSARAISCLKGDRIPLI